VQEAAVLASAFHVFLAAGYSWQYFTAKELIIQLFDENKSEAKKSIENLNVRTSRTYFTSSDANYDVM